MAKYTLGFVLLIELIVHGQPALKRVNQTICQAGSERWTICQMVYITATKPSEGGPQALEGYTKVAHQNGSIGLVMGTIGNVELSGASGTVTKDARALQGGFVVTNSGVVERASSLVLVQPKVGENYTGTANIKEANYILFDNGWRIAPNGSGLDICDPRGVCRAF